MKDKHLEDNLYDYITGRMSQKDTVMAGEHLKGCEKCRKELQTMQETVALLDKYEPPPLSMEFKKKVIQEIHASPFPRKPFFQRIKEWFQIPYFRWSIEGLAVAAAVVLTLTVYRGLTPPVTLEGKPEIRGAFEVELEEVKTPIIVGTKDMDKALSELKELIQANNGKLIRKRKINQDMEITTNIPKESEEKFIQGLSQSGKVEIKGKEYKDSQGNIVVRLKLF
ncbi:MAG: hypothetical protein NT178_16290 [Proteobacteria bacterium]|nr:hypothetical protein [Pseudomonadota bacterium]